MKIFMFFFTDPNPNSKLKPFLYAFTNMEEYKKRFSEYRDMNKFMIVEREIEKSEYKDFCRVHPNQQLTLTKLFTKNDSERGYSHIEIVCTWDEEKNVVIGSDESVFRNAQKVMFDPTILSRDLKICLYELGFFNIYQFLYNGMYIYEPLDDPEFDGVFSKDETEIHKPKNIKIDQLSMFLELYGHTVKE